MSLAQRYAKVVQEASLDGEGAAFTNKLISFMKARGHLSLLPQIVRTLERMPVPDTAIVTVKSEDDLARYKPAIKASLEALGVSGKPAIVIDPRLVGGYAVRAKGKAIDKSFRTALINVYQNIARS